MTLTRIILILAIIIFPLIISNYYISSKPFYWPDLKVNGTVAYYYWYNYSAVSLSSEKLKCTDGTIMIRYNNNITNNTQRCSLNVQTIRDSACTDSTRKSVNIIYRIFNKYWPINKTSEFYLECCHHCYSLEPYEPKIDIALVFSVLFYIAASYIVFGLNFIM